MTPAEQAAHERELKAMDLESAREQAHIKAAADVERERIKGAVKQHGDKLAADREKHTAEKVAEASKRDKPEAPKVELHQPITINVPANKGSKVVRGKDGKIEGTKPND